MLWLFLLSFFHEEYLIALVDFIVALRRTKGRGRRTLRSPPSPWNHACVVHWTPPHPPGAIRCGGAYLLPRAYRDIGSFIPVQTVCPHFDMTFGCFVFGLGLFAFQKISLGFDRTFFIIGRMDCSCLRLRDVLPFSIVGITADRAISSNIVWCKPISPITPRAKVS